MIELLSPAGDFECAKAALTNGCDAIYCAAEQFGARAYAKNFSFEELKKITIFAHCIHKKIYVTVNTILKETELKDCQNLILNLYELGVDALILADLSMIDYTLKHCPEMEVHISTQVGIKDLNDTLFFENMGAHRVVLARENSIEEIKRIKENSSVSLEVFAHGALCVSYSGGCLLSSLLSLRSGNRGRCSQNCRRSYQIFMDHKALTSKGFYLSMKDLNTSAHIKEYIDTGVDSLKLEGRMKNKEYVETLTREYRKLIDCNQYVPHLNTIFHRPYTKGFIFHEQSYNIVDPSKKNNEGEYIGILLEWYPEFSKIKLHKKLKINERIRIEIIGEDDYYFTIDQLYDAAKKSVSEVTGVSYLPIWKKIPQKSRIYRMKNISNSYESRDAYRRPLSIEVNGKLNEKMILKAHIDGMDFLGFSQKVLAQSQNKPITTATLFQQLNRWKETAFYLEKIENHLDDNLFLPMSEINYARRNLLEQIENYFQNKRNINHIGDQYFPLILTPEDCSLSAYCFTEEQFQACRDAGLSHIYFKNYVPYVGASYENIDQDEVLISNYGGLYYYKNKKIITDFSFNVLNSKSVYLLHRMGVHMVTISLEASFQDIKNIYEGYRAYGSAPNLEMIVYGKQKLMTMKYCPLKALNQCGDCQNHHYTIQDDQASFDLLQENCISYLINSRPLNLIDELHMLEPYITRFRLQFTTESYNETKHIIYQFQNCLKHFDTHQKQFDPNKETHGYFKRSIL